MDAQNAKDQKQLRSEQQRAVLQTMVNDLAKERPDLYYQSTSDIAAAIYELIHSPDHRLSVAKMELVQELSRRDIQVLL